jgi:MoaA/NifB/PqqE/SkfB family radical SAM enzyme
MRQGTKLSNSEYFGLGQVPIGIGAILKGWAITTSEYRNPAKIPIVDFRAMTEACPHNCFHCFTDKDKKTLTLAEIKSIIDQLAEAHTFGIDFVGEGEPTIDKDFFEIIEHTSRRGIQATVYTDAAIRMQNRDFVKRVFESGAGVCPKCDSLFNEEYQNWIVGDKKGRYFRERGRALELLIETGFNRIQEDGTTRLGFDMVVTKRNIDEAERTLRYCRDNNMWIIFVSYLPSGRSGREDFDSSLMLNDQDKIQINRVVERVDNEYGFFHQIYHGLVTMPCVEFMQIYGDGRVSPCVGNEEIVGNVKEESIRILEKRILEKYPCHDRTKFEGHCPYRPKLDLS